MTRPAPAGGPAASGLPALLSRRSLLTASGTTTAAVAVGGCTRDEGGRSAPPRSPHTAAPSGGTATTEESAIFDLSFDLETRYRPFQLVSSGFTEVDLGPDELTSALEGLQVAGSGPPAPYAAVELDVRGPTGTVVAGLATDADAGTGAGHVLGSYDPVRGRVGIEVAAGGRTKVVRAVRKQLPDRFRLAVAVCENQVTVLADTGRGWRPLLTERTRVARLVDLRRPEVLASHRYAWGVRGGSGSFTAVRAGLFGMTGLRDLHLVQDADGTPYVRDGRTYLTATCAGLGFFAQAHWGVFTVDLAEPTRLEQVAHLFTARGGLVLGDHAGQVVRDGERWQVATSSWGDFAYEGVHVRHLATTDDVLHGVHVLETEPTPLPTRVGSWDPGMTRIDGRWYIGFVESPSQEPFDFHPALAVGPVGGDGPWDRLELAGAATDLHQCEGPILTEVDGEWWLLASDGAGRAYPVFDLQVQRRGRLDAPYGTNLPHPQLVELPDGGRLLLTFDGSQYAPRVMGYGGHGDVLVMRSRETAAAGSR